MSLTIAFFAQTSYSSADIVNSGVRTEMEVAAVFNPPDREASISIGLFVASTDILTWYRFSSADRTVEVQFTLWPSALR